MDNSLKIGKYLIKMLEHSTEFTNMCPIDRVYGLISEKSPQYPFIVYSRSRLGVTYTKDLIYGKINNVEITVDCHHNSYTKSVELANVVRAALEGCYVNNDEVHIEPMRLIQCQEFTDGDGDFCQVLVFSTSIQ